MLGLVVVLMALMCEKEPRENRAAGSTTLKKSAKSFDWTVLLVRDIARGVASTLLSKVRVTSHVMERSRIVAAPRPCERIE